MVVFVQSWGAEPQELLLVCVLDFSYSLEASTNSINYSLA